MIGVCECLNFAKKAGLDLGKLIDSLSAGAASSWSLVNLGPRMARRDFAPGFKVKLLQKDLRYVLSDRGRPRRASARRRRSSTSSTLSWRRRAWETSGRRRC